MQVNLPGVQLKQDKIFCIYYAIAKKECYVCSDRVCMYVSVVLFNGPTNFYVRCLNGFVTSLEVS